MGLAERIRTVQADIAGAAIASGRSPEDVTLVAVSKTVSREVVDSAYALGLRHFGENRVQDSVKKYEHPLPRMRHSISLDNCKATRCAQRCGYSR